jgi:hypothetical protein
MSSKKFFLMGICVCMSIFFVLQVAGQSPQSQDPAENLKARVDKYWKHRISREYEKSYTFENPERIKGITLTKYIGTFGSGAKWLGAEVEKLNIKGENGLVLMKIRYIWTFSGDKARKDLPKEGLTSKFLDRWKLVDGTWYHQFRNVRAATPKPRARKGVPTKEQTKEKEENKQQGDRQEAK